MNFYVETRTDGLPWTRKGCNSYGSTAGGWGFIPWPGRAEAQAAVDARKGDGPEFDDPMWQKAEYRIVPARSAT